MCCGRFGSWRSITQRSSKFGGRSMARRMVSDSEIFDQIPAARRRAQHADPAAVKARYDRPNRRLHVTLTNGTTLVVPIDLIASLRRAADQDLAAVTIGVAGVGL